MSSNPLLPTGTVTFLFTDIQGSTFLYENYPVHMQAALERHDEILRSCIEEHEGYVFKTVGDASVLPSLPQEQPYKQPLLHRGPSLPKPGQKTFSSCV